MKPEICDRTEKVLVAGEALSAEQQAHLEDCGGCRGLAKTHGELGEFGRTLRELDPSDEQAGARLLAGLEDRRRVGAPFLGPLAWGGLAAGLLLLMMLGTFMANSTPDESAPYAKRLLSLMDEVDKIADGEQTDSTVAVWGQMFATQSEAEQSSNPLRQALDAEELELDSALPTGYQALNDVLEERWL